MGIGADFLHSQARPSLSVDSNQLAINHMTGQLLKVNLNHLDAARLIH